MVKSFAFLEGFSSVFVTAREKTVTKFTAIILVLSVYSYMTVVECQWNKPQSSRSWRLYWIVLNMFHTYQQTTGYCVYSGYSLNKTGHLIFLQSSAVRFQGTCVHCSLSSWLKEPQVSTCQELWAAFLLTTVIKSSYLSYCRCPVSSNSLAILLRPLSSTKCRTATHWMLFVFQTILCKL